MHDLNGDRQLRGQGFQGHVIQENGVGSIRAFLEALDAATEDLPSAVPQPRRCSWVVGQIVAQALQPVAERLNAVDGVEFHLIGLPSPYWGQEQVVTGLLTGQDCSLAFRAESWAMSCCCHR